MIRTAATVLAVLVSPVLAQSEGATATIHLTHDDDDGVIQIGDTVTWTLEIGFTGAEVASTSNMAILGNNALGSASDFNYYRSGTGFNGGAEGGSAEGAGITLILFINSLFVEAFGGDAVRLNPLPIGTFEFTASAAGMLTYEFAKGFATGPFLALDYTAFQQEHFESPADVTIVADTLTIVPVPASALLLGSVGLLAARRRR